MMAQSDASRNRTTFDGALRQLAEIELQARLHRERSESLVADAKRIVAAVRETRSGRPNRSASTFDALLAAKEAADRTNEAKSELLAQVAHDLRQPIQVILGLAELLAPHVAGNGQRLLGRIDDAANRMNHALDALLVAARSDSAVLLPRIAPVPLAGLFEEIDRDLRPAADAKALTLRIRPCGSDLHVLSDGDRLASIVQNLVDNAIKYTDRGKILVGCRRRRAGMVEIQVYDTGRGIAGVNIGSIFEPFHRIEADAPSQRGGVGLGLAIVKRHADTLGHELTVHSALGRGSCFGVIVPIAEGRGNE